MKNALFLLSGITLFNLYACNQTSPDSGTPAEPQPTAEIQPVINTDSIVTTIDASRKAIEEKLGEPIVIETAKLREKIKQKWQKIHFYTVDNKVVRIKTYPYTNISQRTEEFYLDNGAPILFVIEDNGAGERGKTGEQIDKMYYFSNGKLIKEVSSGKETEYSIKESDAEELLSELNEYLEIFASSQAK